MHFIEHLCVYPSLQLCSNNNEIDKDLHRGRICMFIVQHILINTIRTWTRKPIKGVVHNLECLNADSENFELILHHNY